MRKLNEIFGYGLFIVGVAKIILVILVLLQAGTNIIAIFNGGSANSEYYPVLSTTIGFAQLILAVGSIVMIILNIKKQPEVIKGYLYGLGALLLEFVIPPIMSFYFVFVECGMYMKAGTKIRNKNLGSDKDYRKIKQNIKNTEWFYSEKNKIDNENEQIESYNKYDGVKEVYESEKTVNLNESNKEENFVTIVLVSLILIILFGIGFFAYKITSDSDNNKVNVTGRAESMPFINDDNNSVMEEQENTKQIIETITVDEKDTQINDSTLSKIANIFNSCNASQKMRLQGYTINAIATDNKITVVSSGDGLFLNIEFILDNNILYTEVMYNEIDPKITAVKVTLAVIVVDCVGQVKGYPDGTFSTALGDEVAMNYTIENEGIEIKQLSNGKGMVVKVDLNSKFSFLDTY